MVNLSLDADFGFLCDLEKLLKALLMLMQSIAGKQVRFVQFRRVRVILYWPVLFCENTVSDPV